MLCCFTVEYIFEINSLQFKYYTQKHAHVTEDLHEVKSAIYSHVSHQFQRVWKGISQHSFEYRQCHHQPHYILVAPSDRCHFKFDIISQNHLDFYYLRY